MTKRANLVLLGLVASLGTSATAERSKSQRVYLLAGAEAGLRNECLQALKQALKAEIDKTPGVDAAKSSDEADVLVDVKKCEIVPLDVNADVELYANGNREHGRTRGVRIGIGVGVPAGSRGNVALIVDSNGRPQEFTSGPMELPLEDAARMAVRSLLGWVRSGEAR